MRLYLGIIIRFLLYMAWRRQVREQRADAQQNRAPTARIFTHPQNQQVSTQTVLEWHEKRLINMKEETDKQTALILSVNEMVDKIDSRSRLNETFISQCSRTNKEIEINLENITAKFSGTENSTQQLTEKITKLENAFSTVLSAVERLETFVKNINDDYFTFKENFIKSKNLLEVKVSEEHAKQLVKEMVKESIDEKVKENQETIKQMEKKSKKQNVKLDVSEKPKHKQIEKIKKEEFINIQ